MSNNDSALPTLPKHLFAAYEWTRAAGELAELAGLTGDALDRYVTESASNAVEHGATDVFSGDIRELRAWLAGSFRSAMVTNDQIKALRNEAANAGDHAQVALCNRALATDFHPTHIITWRGRQTPVMLVDRVAYTEGEWTAGEAAEWTVDDDGTWVFQGQVPMGEYSVAAAGPEWSWTAAREACARVIADAQAQR